MTLPSSESSLYSPEWIRTDDRRQFHSEGYMVVRNVVPASVVGNAVREIAAFVCADLAESTTWYGGHPQLDGIVPMHHAQSLWDIRQCPNLHRVFTEFFGNPRLMVDINRCIFRPPVHPAVPSISHGTIHWDMDPRLPGPGLLQGVVLLTDVGRDEGGFQCLPEVYQDLDGWLERHAHGEGFDFFNPGLNHWKTTQVEGNAGDVIIPGARESPFATDTETDVMTKSAAIANRARMKDRGSFAQLRYYQLALRCLW